jgi:hypothetical protein
MPTSIFPIQICTYTWNYSYQSSFNATANSISLSQIEQDGTVFDILPPLFLDDVVNINAQLQGLSITQGGNISYTFDGTQADLQAFNIHNPITKVFLIQNINGVGGGSPIPFQMPVTQQLCTFINDPGFVYGCTDPDASNYDPAAQVNTGVCSYNPETATDKMICAITNEAYEFAMLLKAGKLTQEQIECRYLDTGYNLAVINSAATHVYAGTILIPAAYPQDAVSARACIDFSVFSDGAFIGVTVTVDAVSLVDPSGQFGSGIPFWSTVVDFGTALAADITAYTGSNGGYTAEYDDVLNKFCVTAPTTGDIWNGVVLDISFHQDKFYLVEEIPTSNGSQVSEGVYDIVNQRIILGQYYATRITQTFKSAAPAITVGLPAGGMAPAPAPGIQVIINNITGSHFILSNGAAPYIYDGSYNPSSAVPTNILTPALPAALIPGYMANGFVSGTSLWYGLFRSAANYGTNTGRHTGILARENNVTDWVAETTTPLPIRDILFKNSKFSGSYGINYSTVPSSPAFLTLSAITIGSTLSLIVDTGMSYVANDNVRLKYDDTHDVIGYVTAYDDATGDIDIFVQDVDDTPASGGPIAIAEFTLDLYIFQGLNHIRECPFDGTIWGCVGNGSGGVNNNDGIYMFDPATVTLPNPANNLQLNLAGISYPFDICFVQYGAVQEAWVFGITTSVSIFTLPVSPLDVPVVLDLSAAAPSGGYFISGIQHSTNGYVYLANGSGAAPSVVCIVDPLSRSFIQSTNAPVLLTNFGRPLTEDTDTGLMYYSEETIGPEAFVGVVGLTTTDFDKTREFAGGKDEIDYNRDELQQDAADSCYTDEVADKQLQYASDNVNGCCN